MASLQMLQEGSSSIIKTWLREYLDEHLAWWSEIYGVGPQLGLETLVERDWQDLLSGSQKKDCFVRVIADDDPLGLVYAELRSDRYMGIKVGVLSWIYVAADQRGKGLADLLLDGALEWMQGQKVQGREVYVTALNPAAVRLYERHGYRIFDYRMLGPG